MGILEDILKAKAQSSQQLPRFVKDPDLPFEVGDHLKADRVVYDHHGIYIGNKQVIAYLDHEGIAPMEAAQIARSLDSLALGQHLLIVAGVEHVKTRAEVKLGLLNRILDVEDAAGRQQADLLFNKIEEIAINFARAD